MQDAADFTTVSKLKLILSKHITKEIIMTERNRNSDGSYDAVDSGGFGKDYHGQDAFGERMGRTGIGGSHFGGKAAGDFSGADELGEGHFTERYTDYGQAMATESPTELGDATEVASNMKDTLRGMDSTETENSNTGSMDTSFQIGDINEDKERELLQQEYERSEGKLNEVKEWNAKLKSSLTTIKESTDGPIDALFDALEPKSFVGDKIANKILNTKGKAIDSIASLAESLKFDDFDRNKLEEIYKEDGPEGLRKAQNEIIERGEAWADKLVKDAQDRRDYFKGKYESYKASTTDKTKTSFTDKMKPSTTEAKPAEAPGKNMSSAKTSPSDYLTKSNKDSTKELPPSRNDFGNHVVDTFKGVTDRIADNTTADVLGLKSIEDFARENGYDPNKLSTMKAYRSYQNKEIMKATPGIVKQIGSYIIERVKDVVDPSQLGERVRNTLARYNLATLIGAAILSIKSGAGLQASIDQALTMVDTEDQPAVSDYLEDVLSDEGTVNDLGNAFDDALDPQQNSDTAELDESIINIGRKDNTDYDDFNAGLGSSGTTSSDADVKVFIARNVKTDPILRKMISKIGK